MENEDVIYILSVGGFQSKWPSNDKSENPHRVFLKNIVPNISYKEICDNKMILGADGYCKNIDGESKKIYNFRVSKENNIYKDIKHYFDRTESEEIKNARLVIPANIELEIINKNKRIKEIYSGVIEKDYIYEEGESGEISFNFKIKEKISNKILTEEELTQFYLL